MYEITKMPFFFNSSSSKYLVPAPSCEAMFRVWWPSNNDEWLPYIPNKFKSHLCRWKAPNSHSEHLPTNIKGQGLLKIYLSNNFCFLEDLLFSILIVSKMIKIYKTRHFSNVHFLSNYNILKRALLQKNFKTNVILLSAIVIFRLFLF